MPASRDISARRFPSYVWWGALGIVVLTFAAYSPVFDAGYIWDDDSYVTATRLLHDLDGLRRIWIPKQTPQYYPAVFTTFWIEYHLWRLHPAGYHIVNVLLHVVNALLVWRLATMLRLPGGALAAWLLAAVFALHPVHVESVAWITERKNVLSGFFYLCAAIAYLRFDALCEDTQRPARLYKYYGLSFLLFVLALLSKTVTCSLPAALILIFLYQRKRLSPARLVPLLPMAAIGLLLALNTAAIERAHVGAEGDEFAFSFAERLIIASKALLFYPTKLLWPHPIMFIYPRWVINSAEWIAYWPVAVVVVVAGGCVWSYMRGCRGPALALAYYAGTIFPALGFINIYPMKFSFVADHFQYLASLGILSVVIAAIGRLGRKALAFAAIAVLPPLAALTYIQALTYESAETVYRDTLSKNNEAWMPHNNLANIVIDRDPAEAEYHYREALRIKSDHFPAQSNLAEALRRQQRYKEAIAESENAIALIHARMAKEGQSTPPRYLGSDYDVLGRSYHALGHLSDAEEAYRQSIAIGPGPGAPYLLLARILIQQQKITEAEETIRAYLVYRPNDATAHQLLAYIELQRNPPPASPADS